MKEIGNKEEMHLAEDRLATLRNAIREISVTMKDEGGYGALILIEGHELYGNNGSCLLKTHNWYSEAKIKQFAKRTGLQYLGSI